MFNKYVINQFNFNIIITIFKSCQANVKLNMNGKTVLLKDKAFLINIIISTNANSSSIKFTINVIVILLSHYY